MKSVPVARSGADVDIFLDIDGVLLANDDNAAAYANEFLEYVLDTYPDTTYWLTTHCKGDASTAVQRLSGLFPPELVERMKVIKPTMWDIAKTDALDFTRPFLWFDDDCFQFERELLAKHGVFDNWIKVDLAKDMYQLRNFLQSFPIPVYPVSV